MRIYVPISDFDRFRNSKKLELSSQLRKDFSNELVKILRANSSRIDRCSTIRELKINTNDLIQCVRKIVLVRPMNRGILIDFNRQFRYRGIDISRVIDSIQYGVDGKHLPIVNSLRKFTDFWSNNMRDYLRMILYDQELR